MDDPCATNTFNTEEHTATSTEDRCQQILMFGGDTKK